MKKHESTIKVRAALFDNHNQSALHVRQGIKFNHNQSAVKLTRKVDLLHKLFVVLAVLALLFTTVGTAKADQCTIADGQQLIDSGQYKKAILEFTCVIDAQPTAVEGYRGRIEAKVMLGRYSDAVLDYQLVTAWVLPVHPDAMDTILAGYADRLALAPNNMTALTGQSFAHWWNFDYVSAIHVLNHMLDLQPNSPYANLLRGSSRVLGGVTQHKGVVDLEKAITLDPNNPHMRFIVADAYTYGLPDPARAFSEASLALDGGLNTPRIHAILATSYAAFGDQTAAAQEIKIHFDLVTTEIVTTETLSANSTLTLDLVPGRVYEIPVSAQAGELVSILTDSPDIWDTIMVLLAPDGTPILGSDDYDAYFAGFEWTPAVSNTYRLLVTSFESVSTGTLIVTRD